jgi:hypothetical protein
MHCATQATQVNRTSRHVDTFSRLDHHRFASPQGQLRIADVAIPVLVRTQPEIPAGKILYARSRTEMARQASIEKRIFSELLSLIHDDVPSQKASFGRAGQILIKTGYCIRNRGFRGFIQRDDRQAGIGVHESEQAQCIFQ